MKLIYPVLVSSFVFVAESRTLQNFLTGRLDNDNVKSFINSNRDESSFKTDLYKRSNGLEYKPSIYSSGYKPSPPANNGNSYLKRTSFNSKWVPEPQKQPEMYKPYQPTVNTSKKVQVYQPFNAPATPEQQIKPTFPPTKLLLKVVTSTKKPTLKDFNNAYEIAKNHPNC